MSKTIRELADELGVSKTTVRKYMTEEFRENHTENLPGNIIGIDDVGCKLISESLRKPPQTTANQFAETPQTPETPSLQEEVAFLREQLIAKDRQIEAQQTQISQLTAALDNTAKALQAAQTSLQAAQALHAGTMQQQLESGEPDLTSEISVSEISQDPKPGVLRRFWQSMTRRK